MNYKIFLKQNNQLTNETDYYDTTLDTAINDFCEEHGCAFDDIKVLRFSDIGDVTDIDKLAENNSNEYLLSIVSNMWDSIARAFQDSANVEHDIGRLKFQIDVFADLTAGTEINHVNNYYQLLLELMNRFNLTDDDLSDLKGDYHNWLIETSQTKCSEFAKEYNDERYDDRDEWLDYLSQDENLTFVDCQLIDYWFDDNKRQEYRNN